MKWPDDYINRVIHGDCLEVMRGMPDKCVDIVLTDPPYGMNYQSNHRYEKWCRIFGDKALPVEAIHMSIGKARRCAYVFCRWDNLPNMPQMRSVIAWVKNNWSMGDLEHEHGRQWEAICFYPKEDHKFVARIPDVVFADRTGNKYHPTEKPTDLMFRLLSSNEGGIIFDPFCGSGTTLVAAKMLGRRYIGIDIEKKYCDIAEERLRNTTPPLPFIETKEEQRALGI